MAARRRPTGIDAESAQEIPSADFYLRRLERLARILLRPKWESSNDLWRFQIDLLEIQREIQWAITVTKGRPRAKAQYEALTALRAARWHARRLGDTFAWLLLGLDGKVVQSFSANARIPISQENHGSRGALAIAYHFASTGWGFPLMHDVTDCLRIGDITFIRPRNGGRPHLTTIEVKTRLINERDADGGEANEYEYAVTVLSASRPDEVSPLAGIVTADDLEGAALDAADAIGGAEAAPWMDDRVKRQLSRMSKALARRDAPDGQLVEIKGEPPLISVQVASKSSVHWKALRRLIRKSRKEGYASECVEGALLYVALYGADGVDEKATKGSTLPQDIVDSGMLSTEDPENNGIVINAIPAEEGTGAQPFLPYFLYPIPHRAVFDFLHGRLFVFVLVNPAWIKSVLERGGFQVTFTEAQDKPPYDAMVVTTKIIDDAGQSNNVQLHNIGFHVREVVYEFRSLQHLVEVALTMREASRQAIASGLRSSKPDRRA